MITYLIDTSAYVHLTTDTADRRHWYPETETGAIGLCEATRAEILFSARDAVDREELIEDLVTTFEPVRVPKDVWRWVETAQHKLTQRGRHRAAGVVDLILCGTAVAHGLTVLHRDHDFATVSRVMRELQEIDVRRTHP